MRGGQNRLLTDEQHEYFMKHNTGTSQKKMAELMNRKFGRHLTVKQISNYRKNNHLSSGLTGYYPKGNIPWNKGLKWDSGGRSHETRFKPGNVPHNHRPVGSERINTEGYVDIKIADPNKWKPKHIILWESLYGPKPKGCKIIFADGNKLNIVPENLLLVSDNELCRMNQNGWIKTDAEMTKTGVALARLTCKMAERKRKKKKEGNK